MCINVAFTRPTLFAMHDSMKRLIDMARSVTRHFPAGQAVDTFADLGERLNVSSAVMTNWKARGLSKDGALDAQRLWGINALWLLEDIGPASIRGSSQLSDEVASRLAALGPDDLRRAENQLRAFLEMDPLPRASSGKRTGTAG